MKKQPELCEFDIRGQICPSSLLLVLREVNARRESLMDESCHIIVVTDNRDATGTIPDTVENMGFATTVKKVDGYYKIHICKHEKKKNGVV